jgi:hypothetical protein
VRHASNDRALSFEAVEEEDMSNRKPTVDGLDDIDDEDGVAEEEMSEENDLTLSVETAEEAIMGSDAKVDASLDPDELADEELVDEEEA